MQTFDNWFIYWTNLSILLFWFYNFTVIVFKQINVKTYFLSFLPWVSFIPTLDIKVYSFGVLVLILALSIIDFFSVVIRIEFIDPETFHWLWFAKMILTVFRHKDLLPLQVCGKSRRGCRFCVTACWIQSFSLLDIKYPSSSSYKPYLLVVDFSILNLLDQLSLILELILKCDWKISVGCIQTGLMESPPPQVCGRL